MFQDFFLYIFVKISPSFKEKGFDKKTKKKHIILFFEIWDI
jgi:hypothetical protein